MKPRKQLIDAAIANGSIDRMNMLLSAAHLLNCEANSLVEEASDLMTENGLLLGNLKKLHNDFVRVADKYFKEFATLVTTDTTKMDMFSDLDGFDSASENGRKFLMTGNRRMFPQMKLIYNLITLLMSWLSVEVGADEEWF